MNSSEMIQEYYKRQKATLYAMTGHPLDEVEEYVQGLYIKMLCSLLQYHHTPSEEQLLFVERLLRGIGRKDDLGEVMKKALALEENFPEEFTTQFKNNNLKYHFMVDAMVLLASQGSLEDEQIELMAQLCALLNIDHKQADFLTQMAVSILEQDSALYMRNVENAPQGCNVENFRYYTKKFLTGRMIDSREYVYYYACKCADFNKTFAEEEMAREMYTFTADKVIFENWKIDLSDCSWYFLNNKEVQFINCEFMGKDTAINFDGVNSVKAENCSFHNFNKRVFVINDCTQFEMTGCHFFNCLYTYNDSSSRVGGVYYITDKGLNEGVGEKSVKVFGCTFKACGIWNTHSDEYYYAPNNIIGFSENIKQHISYSSFYNCLAYNKGTKEISGRGGNLFNNAISSECELTASNKIS